MSLVRHRDLEEQKYSSMDMVNLRVVATKYHVKSKSKSGLVDQMVKASCDNLSWWVGHGLSEPTV